MKIFQKTPAALILSRTLNLIWYFEWLTGFTFIVMLAISGYTRGAYALQLPVTFEKHTAAILQPINGNFQIGVLNSNSAILSYHVDANLPNIIMILFGYGSVFAVVVLITDQMRKMSKGFSLNSPFQKMSITRINIIAVILIGYSLLQWLFVLVVNQFVYRSFKIKTFELTYDLNFNCLIIGVILLLVVEIFKVGIELEEERKLVI